MLLQLQLHLEVALLVPAVLLSPLRGGLQRYDSLQAVLLMDEAAWRARYPIAQQLAELQAAAAGVAAWERMLCHSPSGARLVQSIDRLHARRGRLVWLQEQGLTDVPCLRVLDMSEGKFAGQYVGYPGDAAMAQQLGSELDVEDEAYDGGAHGEGARGVPAEHDVC
jgi:hypothetical protein